MRPHPHIQPNPDDSGDLLFPVTSPLLATANEILSPLLGSQFLLIFRGLPLWTQTMYRGQGSIP